LGWLLQQLKAIFNSFNIYTLYLQKIQKKQNMNASLSLYKNGQLSASKSNGSINPAHASLVLGFGEKSLLENQSVYEQLRQQYPTALIVICSTSGEIYHDTVLDNSLSVAAMQFEKTGVKAVSINIDACTDSYEAGQQLVNQLPKEELSYLLVISDGAKVNGSELVRGINDLVKNKVPVTGGLAGDAARFHSTLVGLNEKPANGNIVCIGFYGAHLRVGHGTMGGWDMFGPERVITKSIANCLYEIDDKDAIELYKTYLGKYADELPGSALLFPLSVMLPGSADPVVRTILSIDNENKCMVFAGDVPEGSKVRFMRANFDRLVDAATQAGNSAFNMNLETAPKLALLISCVGRKLILDNRVEEEVVAVSEAFGEQTLLTGFYSYGEISPFTPNSTCQLHNQTMTITTFDEN
jgi:hypothetical protein